MVAEPPIPPATAESIARSASAYRRALRQQGEDAALSYLEAWAADRPNGLALIRAGLARGRDLPESRKLFARGVAELELETGRQAHAGIRTEEPRCSGNASDPPRVRWLPDSRHVVVSCAEDMVVDTETDTTVGYGVALSVDPARLPRLRFWPEPPRESLVQCAPAFARIDEDRGILELDGPTGKPVRHRLASLLPHARTDEYTLRCLTGTDLIVVTAVTWAERRDSSMAFFLPRTGTAWAKAEGNDARRLADGRIVVRAHSGVTVIDPGSRKRSFFAAEGGDLSDDGATLVLVVPGPSSGSDMYRPAWPYLQRAQTRPAERWPLGSLTEARSISPSALDWPRIGPLAPTRCTPIGAPPSGGYDGCPHPTVTIAGVEYEGTSDVECSEHERKLTCLDPRGPVHALDPWHRDLVCRIGAHRLPLGVCTKLLR